MVDYDDDDDEFALENMIEVMSKNTVDVDVSQNDITRLINSSLDDDIDFIKE